MSFNYKIQGISLTKTAGSLFKIATNNLPNATWGLKFTDELSPCGKGYNYIIELVNKSEVQDEIFLSEGILIFVPKTSLKRLQGTIIDCPLTSLQQPLDGLWLKKFEIQNPNAKGLCPCGCGDGAEL